MPAPLLGKQNMLSHARAEGINPRLRPIEVNVRVCWKLVLWAQVEQFCLVGHMDTRLHT